jgi:hypothetical protein
MTVTTGRQRNPLRWRRLSWWAEISTIAVGYGLYEATRSTAPTRRRLATHHASVINRVERATHLDPERALNMFLSMHSHLGLIASYYYGTLHFIVTPALLVLLWRTRPSAYPALRSALVIASLSSLAIYWLYPVTPPRLAGQGLQDTLVSEHLLNAGAGAHGAAGFVNLYAALPSLHVGWAFWCAVAVITVTGSKWRFAALLYPLATTLTVVATANHYLIDAFAGILIVGLSLVATHVDRFRVCRRVGAVGLGGGGQWCRERESAAPRDVRHIDRAAVSRHDPAGDRESQASPAVVGRGSCRGSAKRYVKDPR